MRLSRLLPPVLIRSFCSLTVGAAIRLTGSWVPSPGAGQSHELHVDNAQVLGPSDPKVWTHESYREWWLNPSSIHSG